MPTPLIYPPSQNAIQKTLGAQLLVGATASATLSDVTGIQNKKGLMVVDRVDSNGTATASLREYITFTGVSGSTVTGLTRGLAGSTDQTHAVGAIVEFVQDALTIQAILDGLLQVIDTTGTLDTTKVVDLTTAQTLTNKTLTSPKINENVALTATATQLNSVSTLVKASASENVTGTDDDKFITPLANVPAFYSSIYRQAIINGNFDVWQRGTTFTYNDDTFGPDRWNLLTETNGAWTCARDTDVPTGVAKYSAKFSNVTANNQCAMVYLMENVDAVKFTNKDVNFSFYAKTSGTEIANLRAAVLSWNSTADSVTSDVIGTWAQDGTSPTWATNWTAENTPSNLALTGSYQRFSINATVDTGSMANLALVIWVDDGTITSGDDFWISGTQLCAGSVALPLMPKSYEEELGACKRYFETSYGHGTTPGTADGYDETSNTFIGYTAGAGVDAGGCVIYTTEKRSTPTVTIYAADVATGSGTAARMREQSGGGLKTVTGVKPATTNSVKGFSIISATGLTAGRAYGFNWTSSAEL